MQMLQTATLGSSLDRTPQCASFHIVIDIRGISKNQYATTKGTIHSSKNLQKTHHLVSPKSLMIHIMHKVKLSPLIIRKLGHCCW